MTKKSKSKPGKATKKRAAPKNFQGNNADAPAVQEDTAMHDEPEVASTIDNNTTTLHNLESGLLKLPTEIKQKIWIIAITVDEPIKPKQIRERSNKFLWSASQVDFSNGHDVKKAPALTVVALSKVCRALYEEVSLTHLFYKANHFKFEDMGIYLADRFVINYLVALTTPRMTAIRSMTCVWPGHSKVAPKLFTLLAACKGLQNLELILCSDIVWSYFDTPVLKMPGFKDAMIAVEGLQTLTFKMSEDIASCVANVQGQANGRAVIAKLESSQLQDRMKNPRGTSKYKLETFLTAQREAKLDIHGDGRLGEDKKPGLIASRTRNQLRKLETLTDDGTIPQRVLPKYDFDGDLAWYVETVLDSRRSEPDGLPPSVEFQVACLSVTGPHSWQRSKLPAEKSWEDVTVLQNWDVRAVIVMFYYKHPGAYGKEAVIEAWNLRDQDSGEPKTTTRFWHSLTRQLVEIAEREKIRAEAEAAEATKEAAKEAKRAKKTKTKKTLKSKAVNH